MCARKGKRNSREGKDYYRLFSKKLVNALARYRTPVAIGTDTHEGKTLSKIEDAVYFIQSNKLKLAEIVS